MSGHFAIFVLSLCAIIAATQAFDKAAAMAKFVAAGEECQAAVGASDADIQELMKKQAASTAEGKCLRACILKKFQVMTADGKFDKAVANGHAKKFTDDDPEKMKIAEEIGNTCEKIALSSDHCVAAEELITCFHKEIVAHGVEKYEM